MVSREKLERYLTKVTGHNIRVYELLYGRFNIYYPHDLKDANLVRNKIIELMGHMGIPTHKYFLYRDE